MATSAILLAAGLSRRFGDRNKLLLPFESETIVRATARRILAGGPDELVVVLGYQAAQVRAALHDLPVRFVGNPEYASGMGSSIAAGARHADPTAGALLIVLGDMPRLSASTVRALVDRNRALQEDARAILVPAYSGRRGQPVLFGAAYRPALEALVGDRGGRFILERHADRVIQVPVDDPGILQDVDTEESYAQLHQTAMTTSLQPLRVQLRLQDRLFLNCLDGMSDEAARQRLTTETNNVTFIAVHLIDARYYLAKQLGSGMAHPFGDVFENVRGIEAMPYWPPLESVRMAWEAVTAEVNAMLEGISEDDLSTKTAARFPVDDKTLLGTLAFLVHHEAYHIGQLSLLRTAVGLPAMKYGRPG